MKPSLHTLTRLGLGTTLAALLLTAMPAQAHGDKHPASAGPIRKEQKAWGIASEARLARRTLVVTMDDDMQFHPDHIEARLGETVRLVIRNEGVMKHEFVLGTEAELKAHAELMAKFPDMEHDEPYMAHVSPGETGEIVWNFNRAGDFQFACLISDHYQQGMVGTLRVVPRRR